MRDDAVCRRFFRAICLLVTALCVAAGNPGSDDGTAKRKSEADAVISRCLAATGTDAARKAVTTRVSTGTATNPGGTFTGTVTITQAAPGNLYFKAALGNRFATYSSQQGTDGVNTWDVNPNPGPRLLTGTDAVMILRAAPLIPEEHVKSLFTPIEHAGERNAEGEACDVLDCTSADGMNQTRYYSRRTGLLRRVETTLVGPSAGTACSAAYDDYRAVDGVQVPFKLTTTFGAHVQVITLTGVTHNVPVNKRTFAVPAALVPLLPPATRPAATAPAAR